ncbi:MAG: anti-sigma factor antagonist [Chloroflexi bacterium]|nr:MAG: anti-sigma factor antagonist [Chloroflexota bacterium]
MLNINVSKIDHVALIEVQGRIDSTTALEFGQALASAIDDGERNIVLDLANVDYMSSAGLREIVSALKKVKRASGDLRIAQPSTRVSEVLEMAGLDTILQIFPNQTDAVSSY